MKNKIISLFILLSISILGQTISQSQNASSSLFFDPTISGDSEDALSMIDKYPESEFDYNPLFLTFNSNEKQLSFDNFFKLQLDSTSNLFIIGLNASGKINNSFSSLFKNKNIVGGVKAGITIGLEINEIDISSTDMTKLIFSKLADNPYRDSLSIVNKLLLKKDSSYQSLIQDCNMLVFFDENKLNVIMNSTDPQAKKKEKLISMIENKKKTLLNNKEKFNSNIQSEINMLANKFLPPHQGHWIYFSSQFEGRSFKSFDADLSSNDQIKSISKSLYSFKLGYNYFNMEILSSFTILTGLSCSYVKTDNFSDLIEYTSTEIIENEEENVSRKYESSSTVFKGSYSPIYQREISADLYLIPINFGSIGLSINSTWKFPIEKKKPNTSDLNFGVHFIEDKLFAPRMGIIFSFQDIFKNKDYDEDKSRFSFGISISFSLGKWRY